jgi:hypothetical protein
MILNGKAPSPTDGRAISEFALLIESLKADDTDQALDHHENLLSFGWAIVPIPIAPPRPRVKRPPARSRERNAAPELETANA